MRISILVPTYCRVADLTRCLDALAAQDRPADVVVVTVRDTDKETRTFLNEQPGIQVVIVARSGVVAAMNAGLAGTDADVIAITDDDAAPRPDWLARIESHFSADPELGALGGKDWQHYAHPAPHENGRKARPGRLQYWGRVIGQHHWATPGPPRDVDVLKGVNMALRTRPLRQIGFDERLAGTGAQVHWELSLCLAFKRAGWRVMFDPALAVDHYPAARFDEDQRGRFHDLALRNMVYNETLVLGEHFGRVRRGVFRLWAAFIGTVASPGLLQVLRLLLKRDPHTFHRWHATRSGRKDGFAAAKKRR